MTGRTHRDDVANRGNAANVRSVLLIDLDITLFRLNPETIDVESCGDGPTPGRHQEIIDMQLDRCPVCEHGDDINAVARRVGSGDPRTGMRGDPLLAKRFLKLDRNGLVFDWNQMRQQFEDRDIAPESPID